MNIDNFYIEAIELLKKLIAIPSLSKEEGEVASLIENYLRGKNIDCCRQQNNVWAKNKHFTTDKPTVLLNSHIDTVKPAKNYTNDPFKPIERDEKLYGLGSNDAGASVVALLATFLYFYEKENLSFNLLFSATAEEEISGKNGIASILKELPKIDLAIVGEPTNMNMAVAEKGLIVIDCTVKGKAGHTAREEGVNAIYGAIKDIKWFCRYKFPKVSELLGEVKMTVSQINGGYQHNVVPDICTFVVDIRTNECYTNQEVIDVIQQNVACKVKPRSLRLNSSSISLAHPIVECGIAIGLEPYGSPTMSDQALMPFPSIKIGVGNSARSHIADEYVYMDEIKQGIEMYIKLLEKVKI